MAVKQVTRSTFGVKKQDFPVPNLNAMQIDSYQSFWLNELSSILSEFSPIEDTVGGRWRVDLGPEFYLESDPEMNEYRALVNSTSYSAPLYINVTVENLVTKEKKSQRVFVGKIPVMSKKGNFIINGVQKIVVSQIVKSPGVIYTREISKGSFLYTAKLIPARGIWIDFSMTGDGVIYARIDRKKKFPATQLLKLFGITDDDKIREIFKDVDTGENRFIEATLAKDGVTSIDEAVNSIYKKIRPGDIVSIEQGKKYLISMFEDPTKYDFGRVGRYMFDSRLDYKSTSTEGWDYKKTIGVDEVVLTFKELIRMAVAGQEPDSIDSLSNRRVRGVGEWLGNTFKAGLSRVVKNTRDKMSINEDTNFTPAQLVNMRPLAAMVEDFFNTSQLSRFMEQTNFLSELEQRQFMTCSGPGGLTRERAGFDVRDVHLSHYGRLCPVNTPEGPSFGLNVHAAIYSRVNALGFLETPYIKIKDSLKPSDKEILTRIIHEDVLDKKGKIVAKNGDLVTKDLQSKLLDLAGDIEIKVKRFISSEFVWLASQDELKYVIAEYITDTDSQGHILAENVGARKEGNPVQASIEDIDLMDVASNQIFSLSTCLVPFLAHTDGYRVLMGTNHMGQALPLVKPEQPIVATGFEGIAARDSGYVVYSPIDGEIVQSDSRRVIVRDSKTREELTFNTLKFLPSNDHSTINQRVRVSVGELVKKDDVLIEGFGVHNGEFSIGQNIRVAFLPFKGYNYEDAVVLSQRLVQKDKFTSTHIYELVCDVHETRLGDEEVTKDIPNVATDKLRNLNDDGIIRLGAYVESGDILVGKITPKGEVDLSPEDKLIRVLFGEYSRDVKDSSLYLEHGLSGKVISIREFSRKNNDPLPSDVLKRVHIWLATTRQIKPGDKMAGRHGNKVVVSRVLPVEDMPYTADGQPVDIVLNPLGVIGRMNLGQLLETHLGLACEKQGILATTQPLNEIPVDVISEELQQAGFPTNGMLELWDGQTGEKYDKPVTVGYLYYNKLHHLVDDKIHTRSTGPYSLVTQQPLGGRSNSGGQRFGEMEVWALEAYGAAYALQEMLTIKSDDVKGRDAAYESIIKEKPITSPNLPGSFIVLANELTALGIKVNSEITETDDYSNKVDERLALSVDQGDLEK
jgi:DNA-directed RNA polymerase subunit beta